MAEFLRRNLAETTECKLHLKFCTALMCSDPFLEWIGINHCNFLVFQRATGAHGVMFRPYRKALLMLAM